MDPQQRCLQTGAAALAVAILLRLVAGGAVGGLLQVLTSPAAVSTFFFLETGRILEYNRTPLAEIFPTATIPTEDPSPVSLDAVAVFGEADAALVQVNSVCGYDTPVSGWLETALSWNLKSDKPTVLIVHSHGTESYTKTEAYEESTAYRTKDTGYNVVSIGDRLVQALQKQGIQAIHDRTMHDDPSYNASYSNARASISHYLDAYPSIRLVLDIHRDAVAEGSSQMAFTTEDGNLAQLLLVVGTDAGGLTHPQWEQNMSLAVKLHAQLQRDHPGICRPISFRSQRFNQDLSTGALIVEVGGTGNTRQQALAAADALAEAIGKLSMGANLA